MGAGEEGGREEGRREGEYGGMEEEEELVYEGGMDKQENRTEKIKKKGNISLLLVPLNCVDCFFTQRIVNNEGVCMSVYFLCVCAFMRVLVQLGPKYIENLADDALKLQNIIIPRSITDK